MSYNKMEDTIREAYKNVKLFNQIASNLDNVTPDSINCQLSFIFEELSETIEAVERGIYPEGRYDDDNKDPNYNPEVELTDGVCDLFVTVAGLMQKLECAGFDVSGALKKVNENNLSKFPSGDLPTVNYNPLSERIVNKFKLENDIENIQPPNTIKEYNSQYSVYVFKDKETGKIRKPTNFVPVNLSGHEVVGFLSGNKGGV
jgi:hypothetical protein